MSTERSSDSSTESGAIETERKFHIEPNAKAPDLSPAVQLGQSRLHHLRAIYFDTPDFLLARNRRTLRRRTGGGDAGWHLKLPAEGESREEIHLPLGEAQLSVPSAFRSRVAEIVAYAPLIPVVELSTTRRETKLRNDADELVALLCDDTVTATRGDIVTTWRELEVELAGAGTLTTLDDITATLAAGGVGPSASVSKLVQALGEALTQQEGPVTLRRKASVGEVVRAYLAEQIGALQGREPEARADAPEGVHKMRVAIRRLRSALRTFRPFLDAEQARDLRAELKWLGEALGGPRDTEVLTARLTASVAELPEDALIGPVGQRITAEMGTRHSAAHQALLEALDSPRHGALADTLIRWLLDPPLNEYAAARAKGLLPERLKQVARKALKEWQRAEKLRGHEQLIGWHTTRKRAKAARYAFEAAAPVLGEPGVSAAAAWEEVTETLGVVQDAVVARETLLELAAAAEAHGESAFSYGVLYQREIDRTAGFHAAAANAIESARNHTL